MLISCTGMKYWSCCNKKTTDFNQFLAQKGCTEGAHQWTDPSQKKVVLFSCAKSLIMNIILIIFDSLDD